MQQQRTNSHYENKVIQVDQNQSFFYNVNDRKNIRNNHYLFGSNLQGQLGSCTNHRLSITNDNGSNTNNYSSLLVDDLIKTLPITQIACGSHHTVILTERNDLFVTGRNNNTQLGIPNNVDDPSIEVISPNSGQSILSNSYIREFKRVSFGKKIKRIACSSDQTFLVTRDDEIYYCGGNGNRDPFEMISLFNPLKSWNDLYQKIDLFATSCFTSCFIIVSREGNIYVSGSQNSFNYGMLGVGLNVDVSSSRGRFHRVTLPSSPSNNNNTNGMKPKICAMGGQHSIIVTENNDFYCSGSNMNYQLGFQTSCGKQVHFVKPKNIPFTGRRIEQVACGYDFSFVLVEGNLLYACGNGISGALGTNSMERINFFTRISIPFKIKHLSCGEDFTIIMTTNGLCYRTGNNKHSQLGLKNTPTRPIEKLCKFEPMYLDDGIDKVVCGVAHVFLYKSSESCFNRFLPYYSDINPLNCCGRQQETPFWDVKLLC